jgi:hypothetical protein
MMESDPSLRRAFLRYNDLYFDGRLPHDLTLYWEPSRGNLAETCELETLEDTGGTPDLVVRLDPTLRFSSRMWHFTLLHELVHVDLYPHRGHGKRFQKEMLRLANAGAFHKLW